MRNKKQILMYSLMSFLSILLLFSDVEANNPSNMTLSYNSSTQILSVEITHIVSDPNTHYIESVEVRVNDSTVVNQAYTDQPTTSTFTYAYDIVANTGATIFVRAICSISGSISDTITVGGGGADTPVIPGFIGYLWILTLMLSMAILIIHRKLKVSL